MNKELYWQKKQGILLTSSRTMRIKINSTNKLKKKKNKEIRQFTNRQFERDDKKEFFFKIEVLLLFSALNRPSSATLLAFSNLLFQVPNYSLYKWVKCSFLHSADLFSAPTFDIRVSFPPMLQVFHSKLRKNIVVNWYGLVEETD